MNKEATVQSSFCTYMKLQYPNLRYCASLGGIRTSMKQAILAKKTGYVKGFPDMQILKTNKQYAGLFIEIKADKKCYPTKHQKDFAHKKHKQLKTNYLYFTTNCLINIFLKLMLIIKYFFIHLSKKTIKNNK
jgi:hypothetical protein